MIKEIVLLNKTWDYETIQIKYNLNTQNTCICLQYLNKKQVLKRVKDYRESEEGKKVTNAYWQSEKGKKVKARKDKKYAQSNQGKITMKRVRAKRKRNLGFNILYKNPFNDSIEIDYHHINDNDVVALPKDLHHLYMGKHHRENTLIIVKQIYKKE